VKEYLAGQLNLLWDYTEHYPPDERTRRYHLALIRGHTGWRAPIEDSHLLLRYLHRGLLDESQISNPAPNREETGAWANVVFERSGSENAWRPLFEFCGHQAVFESRKLLKRNRKEE
jgi:hypothetical protein